MQAATLNLPAHNFGNIWEGFILNSVKFNGAAPANSLVSCKIYFRNSRGDLGYKLKSSSVKITGEVCGDITIADAANWAITVPKQLLPLAAGEWFYDIKCIDSAGESKSPVKGSITITPMQTND